MTKVYVGLSGGVDSAVAAALLKRAGYSVVGAFIKIWQPEFIECTWKEDRLDAMRVCVSLGIPFREIDLSAEYKKEVIDSMVADYAKGRTPNPDVLCNSRIKFGVFARWAYEAGADMVATGHYARVRERDERYELLRGKDAGKDQSYFVYRLGQQELARTLFPVGHLTKERVRAEAARFTLPIAAKPDSQGLCFVGEVSMRDFLSRYIPPREGPVVDMQGERIGTHQSAAFYTIGQRHGFDVRHTDVPLYVVGIDTVSNTIRVSPRRADAERASVILTDEHWVADEPAFPLRVFVQTRYREVAKPAELSRENGRLHLSFERPHIAPPGQSAVFYLPSDTVLGGAVIAPYV